MSLNYPEQSDQETSLIKRLLSKQVAEKKRGWEYIYKICHPMILDFIIKSHGTEEDAIDVFQDGLVIFHHNLTNGTFREESSIPTYIFSICKNLWLRQLSKRQKQLVAEAEMTMASMQEFNYLINVEVVSLLMNELKEDCRNILTEYYYNNKSIAELKEIFNVNSEQAAKNKKWRCMNYLVKLFKERRITPSWE
jgi:RNA polymerase sigma factor (sigma-70 family)